MHATRGVNAKKNKSARKNRSASRSDDIRMSSSSTDIPPLRQANHSQPTFIVLIIFGPLLQHASSKILNTSFLPLLQLKSASLSNTKSLPSRTMCSGPTQRVLATGLAQERIRTLKAYMDRSAPRLNKVSTDRSFPTELAQCNAVLPSSSCTSGPFSSITGKTKEVTTLHGIHNCYISSSCPHLLL
eukprot:766081-Hanusia_phi.AAC.5